jgi:mRNA deadenylase 3'-5' endonuclease subunit Ccr4
MKFGILKTKIENKLVESFKNNTLKEDLNYFRKNILSDKDFCKMMSVYDNLSENKNVDKETATFIVDDLVSEFKKIKLKESTKKYIDNKFSD